MLDTHLPGSAAVRRDTGAREPQIPALAAWAAATRAFPSAARDAAQRALIDIVGCMVAGSDDAATAAVRAAGAAWGNGVATAVGDEGAGWAPPWAAMLNGTAAHALDFDDTFDPAKAHITAVLAPALLALAEAERLPGRAVIDAYVVGTELAAALGRMLNPDHRAAGWHATSTIGAIAAAGACGSLLGLDAARLAHALAIATSFAGGTMAQFGTPTKALHAGHAASAGVLAASFARHGLAGAADALDGPYGLEALMEGSGNALPAPGAQLAVLEPGLKLKLYPCCASAHRAIDGALALHAAHGFAAAEVARVHVQAPAQHLANLMHPRPKDVREARFSLPYAVAAALVRGALTLEDFRAAALSDPAVQELMPRIAATPRPGPDAETPTTVEIALTDGRVLTTTVRHPRGDRRNPLPEDALWRKFDACCAASFAAGQQASLRAALLAFDSERPAAELMELLRR